MKVDEPMELFLKKSLGIKPIGTEMGIDAFVKGLATERSQFAVLEGVREKVEVAWGLRKQQPALAEHVAAGSPARSATTTAADASGEEVAAWLKNELTQIVVDLLKLPAVAGNAGFRRALAVVTPVVGVRAIETDRDHIYVALRASPRGLPRAIAALRGLV